MLADKLRARIAADGPMPFEEYMAACLYDPDGGFFTTGPLRSVKEGDFLTSPEVSPWFGRTLARFVDSVSSPVGGGAAEGGGGGFFVVDVGAGSGSLLAPMMEELGSNYSFHAIEASPAARGALQSLVGDGVHGSIDGLPQRFNGIVFANELLDNFPTALAIRSGNGWVERWVGATGTDFGLVTADVRPAVASWCDAYAGNVPDGGMVEVQLAATHWIGEILARINHGALVVIDYGGTAEELEPRRTQGTLRTYQRHHLGPDPLLEPGATDVTVDVNFTALIAAGEEAGATVDLHRQDDFLTELGLREVVSDLRHQELELAKGDDAMARLKVRSEGTDADTLLHPRGLGDFRVMVAVREREN